MNKRYSKFSVGKYEKSDVLKFRETFLVQGYDLVDITHLCTTKIDSHGNCNEFNEPSENIYHMKIMYRDEIVANAGKCGIEVIDLKRYAVWGDEPTDFIIFKIVKK
jgi:hypothetical protein